MRRLAADAFLSATFSSADRRCEVKCYAAGGRDEDEAFGDRWRRNQPIAVLGLVSGATDVQFSALTPALAIMTGVFLLTIQFRRSRGFSIFQRQVQADLRKPLGLVERRLAIAAGICFVGFLLSFLISG